MEAQRMNRRGFLFGSGAILAAFSIVRVSSLMPVISAALRGSMFLGVDVGRSAGDIAGYVIVRLDLKRAPVTWLNLIDLHEAHPEWVGDPRKLPEWRGDRLSTRLPPGLRA